MKYKFILFLPGYLKAQIKVLSALNWYLGLGE